MLNLKRISLILIFGSMTAFLVWYGIHPLLNGDRMTAAQNESALHNSAEGAATILQPARSLGDFALTDTQNQVFTQRTFQGHWTLLFFGYSQCPEICPRTLAIVSDLFRSKPNPQAVAKAQFVFVSLDSKTDTVSELKTFLNRFNPDFIGLTGDEKEIAKLAKACRIYSWTAPNLNSAGQKVIDHSATILLINPEGKLEALFSPPHVSSNLAKELKLLMNR